MELKFETKNKVQELREAILKNLTERQIESLLESLENVGGSSIGGAVCS